MRKPICLSLRPDVIEALDAAAEADSRSRSALADLLIERGLQELEATSSAPLPVETPQVVAAANAP